MKIDPIGNSVSTESAQKPLYTYRHRLFSALSNLDVYHALKLRSDVFVVEQNCVYPDLDDKDTHPNAFHILVEPATSLHGKPPANPRPIVAYARCLAPGVSYTGASIGRVVVAKEARGQGVAKELMKQAIALCKQEWSQHKIQIGAQVYLQTFYQELGFIAISEPYDEDGILHIDMQL